MFLDYDHNKHLGGFKISRNFLWLVLAFFSIVLSAPLGKLLPNWSYLGALIFFLSPHFNQARLGVLFLTLALLTRDLFLEAFYPGWFWVYLGLLAYYGVGQFQPLQSKSGLIVKMLSGSFLFFIMSNFGVWWQGGMYPLTTQGLLQCYWMALPFYKNTVLSDICFFCVGLVAKELSGKWVEKKISSLLT